MEIFTDIIFSTSISNESGFDNEKIADNVVNIESSFSLSPIMFLINDITIWVLSHILIEGMRIKKENELKI